MKIVKTNEFLDREGTNISVLNTQFNTPVCIMVLEGKILNVQNATVGDKEYEFCLLKIWSCQNYLYIRILHFEKNLY